jgi:hypothetical protein
MEDWSENRRDIGCKLRQISCALDDILVIHQEIEQEEASNMEGKEIEELAEANKKVHPSPEYNDKVLAPFPVIESIELQKLHLVLEKVGIPEKIKKPKEKYNLNDQDIKNRDLWEQDIVKTFERPYDAVKMFDNKLNRKFLNGVFFLWCVRWSFDPGRPFNEILQSTHMELFSNFNYGKKNLG